MASAIAMMAKRRYQTIVAQQTERAARQKKKTKLCKPPVSSDGTLVWYWELDGVKITVMYDVEKREVWCNGLILKTQLILPDNSTAQCSIGFTIDNSPECECCGMQHTTKEQTVAQDEITKQPKSLNHEQQKEDTTKAHKNEPNDNNQAPSNSPDSNESTKHNGNEETIHKMQESIQSSQFSSPSTPESTSHSECDCLTCYTGKHDCVIKVVRVAVGETLHELYVDGVMIQEHRDNPYNYTDWKQEDEKKND